MSNTNEHNFRVYKATNYEGAIHYTAFANFKTVQDAVDYMKRWNPNQIYNWYIHDVDCDVKYSYNAKKQLIVTKPKYWNIDE